MNIQDFCSQQQNAYICNDELFKPLLDFMRNENNQFPFLSSNSPQNDAKNPQAGQDIKFPQVPVNNNPNSIPAWESRPQRPNNKPDERPDNKPQLPENEHLHGPPKPDPPISRPIDKPQLPDEKHNFGLPRPESKPGILPQIPNNDQIIAPQKPIDIPGTPIDDSNSEPGHPNPETFKQSPESEPKLSDFEEVFNPPNQDKKLFPSLEIPDITPIEPGTGNPDPSNGNVNPPTEESGKECNIKAFESLKGATYKPKTKEFVKKDGAMFVQSALPKLFRVVGPRSMLTMDFVPERVNIKYEPKDRSSRDESAEGIVTGFSCG